MKQIWSIFQSISVFFRQAVFKRNMSALWGLCFLFFLLITKRHNLADISLVRQCGVPSKSPFPFRWLFWSPFLLIVSEQSDDFTINFMLCWVTPFSHKWLETRRRWTLFTTLYCWGVNRCWSAIRFALLRERTRSLEGWLIGGGEELLVKQSPSHSCL